ncbi:alpha/beta hydrolase [Arthrobacter sp. Sa2BUA2]|uniref:Alpha/beta hydrolase n=1 Tax=Arthrobacter pullicola TaxID=2762224 RepID=A0ABR8YMQ8_9MICC|nr:alpha/beta hydrolase [Arthrobacter pullicola]MBD8045204.1 alpha/beta hydrolase [Arthrobacter pullicola]
MMRPWSRRRWAPALAAASALVLALLLGVSPASTADNGRHGGGWGGPKPTVVLVHGAFADASGWSHVGKALQDDGYPVLAFSNPLRDVQYDSQYLRDFLGTIEGPVVLVGHSYGGALITNAATGNPKVKSLVYIAAFALDEGETAQAALALGGGHTDVVDHLIVRPFPGAAEGNGDAYIDPAYFPQLFAQDLPRAEARFMAASQRPAALATLVTPSGEPAWKTIPSWYMVATRDRIIPPEAERAMAKRAGATTVEVKSSHVPMLSNPGAVTSLIKKAAR